MANNTHDVWGGGPKKTSHGHGPRLDKHEADGIVMTEQNRTDRSICMMCAWPCSPAPTPPTNTNTMILPMYLIYYNVIYYLNIYAVCDCTHRMSYGSGHPEKWHNSTLPLYWCEICSFHFFLITSIKVSSASNKEGTKQHVGMWFRCGNWEAKNQNQPKQGRYFLAVQNPFCDSYIKFRNLHLSMFNNLPKFHLNGEAQKNGIISSS